MTMPYLPPFQPPCHHTPPLKTPAAAAAAAHFAATPPSTAHPVGSTRLITCDSGANVTITSLLPKLRDVRWLKEPQWCSGISVRILAYGILDLLILDDKGNMQPFSVLASYAPELPRRGAAAKA